MNEPFSPQTPRYISPAGDANVLPATPHPRRTTDRRDAAAALVLLVLSVLGVSLSLFGGFHLGYTVSYLAITGCGLIYLSGRRIAGEAGGRCLPGNPPSPVSVCWPPWPAPACLCGTMTPPDGFCCSAAWYF